MFDIGGTELLVIGVVALIVVGPKDLPALFQTVGKFVGKAKGMAREFSQAMNDAANESGVSDFQKTLRSATDPMSSAMDEVKKTADSFTKSTMESGRAGLSEEGRAKADAVRERAAEMADAQRDVEAASDEIEAPAVPAETAGTKTGAQTGTDADEKPGDRA